MSKFKGLCNQAAKSSGLIGQHEEWADLSQFKPDNNMKSDYQYGSI